MARVKVQLHRIAGLEREVELHREQALRDRDAALSPHQRQRQRVGVVLVQGIPCGRELLRHELLLLAILLVVGRADVLVVDEVVVELGGCVGRLLRETEPAEELCKNRSVKYVKKNS